ncbi:MAG: alpha/beta fold hydrolase [Deltaproteobacteria bacterium]|nr:alpha/beta fold hydrolase [Deltaproteobacteria bacterium]
MSRAALLIHGMTGAPAQLQPQQQALESAGWTVGNPLLLGHGTDIRTMESLRWEEWYQDVVRVARDLQQRTATTAIDLVGLSFGGLLGLKLAIDHPTWIRRMVCMAAPLCFSRGVRCLLPLARWTPLRFRRYWKKDYARAVADPIGRARYRAMGYDRFPTRAVLEMARLQRTIWPQLSRITTPLLIVHARHDATVPRESSRMLFDAVQGPKRFVVLEQSLHVVTLDREQAALNAHIVRFLSEALPA